MEKTGKLSATEFLDDVRLTIASPASRFPVIQERGALWGSLLLLIGPTYFAFAWWGGVFFDRDPFPGYSFILPLLPAAAATLIKVFGVHLVARLFEGRGHYKRGKGRFRSLLVVFGYAGIPMLLALILWLVLIGMMPATLGSAFLNLRVLAISLMFGLFIGILIWYLILMVLALRTVYVMHDLWSVISVVIGPLLAILPAIGLCQVACSTTVELDQVRPLLSDRVLRFKSAEEAEQPGYPPKLDLYVDWSVYDFKAPQRYELAVYLKKAPDPAERRKRRGGLAAGIRFLWTLRRQEDQAVGRIVGLPGESVEMREGKLAVNGQLLKEPYLLQEYQASFSYGPAALGATDYLILPEDRRMAGTMLDSLTVPRDRILGRAIVREWPVGWFYFRTSAFAKPGD